MSCLRSSWWGVGRGSFPMGQCGHRRHYRSSIGEPIGSHHRPQLCQLDVGPLKLDNWWTCAAWAACIFRVLLLFSVQGAPNLGGCTEHRSSQFTYTFSLYTWMTKNVNGFEYLRLCEGRDRHLGSELNLTPGPVSFSRPH
ncbi:hypothetical protein HaLaN_33004, partial [Haematococcus lacustris]